MQIVVQLQRGNTFTTFNRTHHDAVIERNGKTINCDTTGYWIVSDARYSMHSRVLNSPALRHIRSIYSYDRDERDLLSMIYSPAVVTYFTSRIGDLTTKKKVNTQVNFRLPESTLTSHGIFLPTQNGVVKGDTMRPSCASNIHPYSLSRAGTYTEHLSQHEGNLHRLVPIGLQIGESRMPWPIASSLEKRTSLHSRRPPL